MNSGRRKGIQNLSIDQQRVRAADVRVSPQLFNDLKNLYEMTQGVNRRLLRVTASSGEYEAVFDGGFLACKEVSDSMPSSHQVIEEKKRTISSALTERIMRVLLSIPSDQLATRRMDDSTPIIVFSTQDILELNFGLYDKTSDSWMSYEQSKRGRGRESFMHDVFSRATLAFQHTCDELGLPYTLRFLVEGDQVHVFLHDRMRGMRGS